jgi:parvulin-like peptidyl-prolyl isomerase
MRSLLGALLREPMVQFLAAGAGCFLLFQWSGSGEVTADRVLVTSAHVQHLSVGFARTWQRPPTEAELKGLIDEHVRDEIAAREARRLGLDRDDTLVRRRLRQKLEYLVEDDAQAAPPPEAELQAWLDAHPDTYRRDPQVAFRQVLVSAAAARPLLARLTALGPGADVADLGDPLRLLPGEVGPSPRREVAGLFGDAFADGVLGLPPGRWAGPIQSGYGLHLVVVAQRTPGQLPALAEVREQVVADVLAARRVQRIEAMYRRLLERHPVVIEGSIAAAPMAAR